MWLRHSTDRFFSAEQFKTGWPFHHHARHRSWSADCFRFTPRGDPDNDRITGGGGGGIELYLAQNCPDYQKEFRIIWVQFIEELQYLLSNQIYLITEPIYLNYTWDPTVGYCALLLTIVLGVCILPEGVAHFLVVLFNFAVTANTNPQRCIDDEVPKLRRCRCSVLVNIIPTIDGYRCLFSFHCNISNIYT
jgi:hypothetical protein